MSSLPLLTITMPLDPVAFRVGGLEITWHGLLAALGVVVGVVVAVHLATRAGFSPDQANNVALALVIGGIIGARALYVVEHLDFFVDNPGQIFRIDAGGISIFGALAGGALGAWLYARLAGLTNKLRAGDAAAVGAMIGMAVGRVGDIINGEHFAKATSLPWGIRYTDPQSPSYIRFGADYVQHPAVAYDMLGGLAIFLLLLFLFHRVPRPGITLFTWIFLYAGMRLGLGFLRLDETRVDGLSVPQVIALGVMPIALAVLVYLVRTPYRGPSRAERRRLLRMQRRHPTP